MVDIILFWLGLAALLALDLVLVATRASFLQANTARLISIRDHIDPQAGKTLALLPVSPRMRASMNLSLVLMRFSLAVLCFWGANRFLVSSLSAWIVPALLFLALLVFWLEWMVERTVVRNAEAWALRLTGVAQVLSVLTWLLLVPLFVKPESDEPMEQANVVTEDELKNLVDAGEIEGIFEQGERRMIFSIFQLGDTLAREIMVPRIDMMALDVMTPLPDAVDSLLATGYSRTPVYEDTVDTILGLLYAKDLLKVWREGSHLESLRQLVRPAHFVPEAKKVDELLAEMQNKRIHMAIVVDEYGGVAGLVTLEDIVEEIVGEILDEYDQGEVALVQEQEDGEFIFLGRVDLDDFNEIMSSNLQEEDADTLGGFIYSRLGRVPVHKEVILVERLELVVEEVSGRRIHKVRARWKPDETVEATEDDEE